MKVLSIIITYNFEPWLEKSINSLLESTYPTDIIVIDNNSHDNTVQVLKTTYPNIKIVENKYNAGFGQGNNTGMLYALDMGYDYVFLVNQDTWIAPDCLQRLLAVDSLDKNIGIISPIHKDGTGNSLDLGFMEYVNSATQEGDLNIVKFINAAFWLIPIRVLRQVGVFSTIFHHYGEDKDYANRINYYGLKIVFVKEAFAFHDRQNRNVSKQDFLKSEYVYFLTEYCNINYSGSQAFFKSVMASGKKMLISFFKQDFHTSQAYFSIMCKLVRISNQVFKQRSHNK